MKILIFKTAQQAAERAASIFLHHIRCNPMATLGLATGGTMEPVYAWLCEHGKNDDFSQLTTFNLDEYIGVAPDHPQSYRHYMARHLFDALNFDTDKTHLPLGNATSAEAEADRYEQLINHAGCIDLQLLGIGSNGHIGFNEPGSSFGSRTRIKTLSAQTRRANARFFANDDDVPRHAITMGIGTIMSARRVLVVATGDRKSAALAQLIEGAVSARWPATVLQFHPDATIVADEAAASKLELRDYYETVHPGGKEVTLG